MPTSSNPHPSTSSSYIQTHVKLPRAILVTKNGSADEVQHEFTRLPELKTMDEILVPCDVLRATSTMTTEGYLDILIGISASRISAACVVVCCDSQVFQNINTAAARARGKRDGAPTFLCSLHLAKSQRESVRCCHGFSWAFLCLQANAEAASRPQVTTGCP
jgi:hypothetical protein